MFFQIINKNNKDRCSIKLKLNLMIIISISLTPIILTCRSIATNDNNILSTIFMAEGEEVSKLELLPKSSGALANNKLSFLHRDTNFLQTARVATTLKQRYNSEAIYKITANVARDLYIVRQKHEHIKLEFDEYKTKAKRLILALRITVLIFVLGMLIKLFGRLIIKIIRGSLLGLFKG